MPMELVKTIVRKLNTVPVGVEFNFTSKRSETGLTHAKPMKYCEAVYRAMMTGRTFVLASSDISCQAAREVFGIADEKSSAIKNHLGKGLKSIKSKESMEVVVRSTEILKMKNKPDSITIGPNTPKPDIYILYLKSKNYDKIIKAYAQLFYNNKMNVILDMSNIMPVCYNCTVRPYLKDNISFSWVMGDTGNCNGFVRNRLVVGIPKEKIEAFINNIEEDG